MKRTLCSSLVMLAVLVGSVYGRTYNGTGEPNDPFRIETAEDMNDIGNNPNDWDKSFVLVNDINLGGYTETQFNIIGKFYGWNGALNDPFTGTFNGNGHIIYNFRLSSTEDNGIGLFGYVGEGGEIKNLGLADANIDAGEVSYVGGIIGYNYKGTIVDCYFMGSVSGKYEVGGLVGFNDYGTISNCYSTGHVSGRESQIGGLVGLNSGTIMNCYSAVSVSGKYTVGGLVGDNHDTILSSYSTGSTQGEEDVGGLAGRSHWRMFNCYSSSRVTGNYSVGGLVGYNGSGWITNCYSTGSVSGNDSYVGGLVASNQGKVSACFWDIDTSGEPNSAGGIGKTTVEMQIQSTFTDAGWDFVGNADGPSDVWASPTEGGYPILYWQLDQLPPLQTFSGGSGTPVDPYIIASPADMNSIGHNPQLMDKHFLLVDNINMEQNRFHMIGRLYPFTGVFDGNGHIIRNFTWISDGADSIGLFGYVDKGGEVKNLGLEGISINAEEGDYVGGLVGSNGGMISNCFAVGSILASNYVGGLVGRNGHNEGTVLNCYAAVSVKVEGDYAGGLVGYNNSTILYCYSTGEVVGTGDNVGGLAGRHWGRVEYSYWDIETSGQSSSLSGIGKTTAELQTANTFFTWGTCGNEGIWTLDEGNDYPRLWWENKQGNPLPTYQLSDFMEGSGTETDPYLVYTVEQLNRIGLFLCGLDKHFKLMSDVNLSGLTGTDFNIIGNSIDSFTGVFDGNGHIIRNFTWISTGLYSVGLFRNLTGGGEIKNLGLEAVTVDANNGGSVGGLLGYASDGKVSNCYVTGTVSGNYSVGGLVGSIVFGFTMSNCYAIGNVSGNRDVGGLIGMAEIGSSSARIENCYAICAVQGNRSVGGFLGMNGFVNRFEGWEGATVENCYATGTVSGDYYTGGLVGCNAGNLSYCFASGGTAGETCVGGLVGWNSIPGTISNCYSRSDTWGNDYVGGLVGLNGNLRHVPVTQPATVENCYATGSIIGSSEHVGGLIGAGEADSTVLDSFWDVETSEIVTSAGGIGKPTVEMQMQNTFTDVGWDFNTPVWTIRDGFEYPRHWWEVLSIAPVSNAGQNQNAPVMLEVSLDASGSYDPDEDYPLTYYWQTVEKPEGSVAGMSNPEIVNPTIIPDVVGEYIFELIVTDSMGLESEPNYVVIRAITIEEAVDETLSETIYKIGEIDPNNLNSLNLATPLTNKVNAALAMIEEGNYEQAIEKLRNDILKKTDGCAAEGSPDKNDWLLTCEDQEKVYPLIVKAIELLQELIE